MNDATVNAVQRDFAMLAARGDRGHATFRDIVAVLGDQSAVVTLSPRADVGKMALNVVSQDK